MAIHGYPLFPDLGWLLVEVPGRTGRDHQVGLLCPSTGSFFVALEDGWNSKTWCFSLGERYMKHVLHWEYIYIYIYELLWTMKGWENFEAWNWTKHGKTVSDINMWRLLRHLRSLSDSVASWKATRRQDSEYRYRVYIYRICIYIDLYIIIYIYIYIWYVNTYIS
jgi:hypothetical protein